MLVVSWIILSTMTIQSPVDELRITLVMQINKFNCTLVGIGRSVYGVPADGSNYTAQSMASHRLLKTKMKKISDAVIVVFWEEYLITYDRVQY